MKSPHKTTQEQKILGWDTSIENKDTKEKHLMLEYEIMGLGLVFTDFTPHNFA